MPKKTSGGQRKHGRNKTKCQVYKDAHTREHNKARKLAKHLVCHSQDASALMAFRRLRSANPVYVRGLSHVVA